MKYMTYEEVMARGGCVYTYINSNSETFEHDNAWEQLARMMISYKLHKVAWIKRMKEDNRFDGTRCITFYGDSKDKYIFTYKA